MSATVLSNNGSWPGTEGRGGRPGRRWVICKPNAWTVSDTNVELSNGWPPRGECQSARNRFRRDVAFPSGLIAIGRRGGQEFSGWIRFLTPLT